METEGSLEGVVITALVDSTLSVKWGENKLIIIYIYILLTLDNLNLVYVTKRHPGFFLRIS